VLNLAVFAGLGIALSQWIAHVGIAIAISAAGMVQLLILLALLRKKTGPLGLREVVLSVVRIIIACSVMSGTALGISRLGLWSDGADVADYLVLACALAAGGAVYVGTAWLLRAPELEPVMAKLSRRILRANR
jgi:putative peptidoglycan lipid II flippase